MAESEIHKLDIGTSFELTLYDNATGTPVLVDVSTATVKSIIFEKPDGTIVTKEATFVTDGSDGKINYVTVTNDLDLIGNWKIQGKVTMPTGSWYTDISKFKVYDNLG